MTIDTFPPIERADEHGLLAVGGDLEIESLLLAYRSGIFPWPISEKLPLAWFAPNPRGILHYNNLHLPKRFQRELKKNQFELRFNHKFEEVIEKCAQARNRKDGPHTWITDEIIQSFIDFHHAGHAFSAEAYNQNNELVGGLYGVNIGGYVTGESMFYEETNASKFVLVGLMEKLHQEDIDWIDTQMVTSVVKTFGGSEISREEFMRRLNISLQKRQPSFFSPGTI